MIIFVNFGIEKFKGEFYFYRMLVFTDRTRAIGRKSSMSLKVLNMVLFHFTETQGGVRNPSENALCNFVRVF